jgi:TP901 family phage tail tape measure protein
MQAYMNIQVRVMTGVAAAQLKMLQAQIAALNGAMAAAGATANGPGFIGGTRQLSALSKFGNQLQWTGRQLQYNFTLPIVLAGAAAMNFALDNEQAFTRVAKVYGDAGMAADTMKNELNSLREAFEALSNHYGVQQKEVLAIAADWAAAGASGVALARGVEQTLRVMVLGEMEAAEATQALIAIQAQYNLSSAELVDTIAKLNVVENQTAISMTGLIQGFQRAAGVARSAGVDVDHLAAFLAALVPAAGTAAQAGNALKTILSRIMSPTARAAEVMKEMGINIQSVAWTSANGAQRIEILAQKFHGLADSQRAVVSEAIASRYQINKFEILMDQVFKASNDATKGQSRYAQALAATSNRSKYLAQAEKELRQVLESNPQKLKQIWVILQNAMADIIIPLIPVLLMAANGIRRLAEAFRSLPPEVQKAITFFLLFIALFGPLLRYIGSTMTLIGELSWFFGGLAKAAFGAGKALLTVIAFPFMAVASGIGAMAGAMGRLAIAAFAGARSLLAFALAGPIFSKLSGLVVAIMTAMGRAILLVWTFALTRMAVVTGPALALISRAFMLWSSGMLRLMTLIRTIFLGGWLAIIASSRVVGPALIATFRALFIGLATVAGAGAAYVVGSVRAMFLAMSALFMNWKAILLRTWGVMWAGIVTLTRGGLLAVGRALLAAASTLLGPWGIAIAAVLAVLYMFRDQLAQLVQNIVGFFQNIPPGIAAAFKPIVNIFNQAVMGIQRAFNALPKGVRDALIAVVNIVASAARQVYELFSYLNPFAHHSPSLVENVTNGMAIIKKQIASITDVGSSIKQAYRELKAFGEATKKLLQGMDKAGRAEDRANIAKVAPGALDEFDTLVKRIMSLTVQLNNLKAAVDAQQSVVDKWKTKLDAANDALDAQQKKLTSLQNVLDVAKDKLGAAQDALQKYANTPITGMKAMEDQIFANEMAQKRLRLEMMKIEDAGGSVDKLTDKMAALKGQMELLSGERTSLRDAGAGSEILSVYDDQIKAIEDQTKGVSSQINEYEKLSDELDKLQRQGEELDLEKSLKFDELTRQIEDAANATKEMDFSDIISGINKSNQEIAKYTDEVNKATAAVDAQQKVVDAATAARDAINEQYDAEVKKLDLLKDAYDSVNSTISDINSSLSEMASAAQAAIQAAEAAKKANANALGAAGDFPDVGGAGSLGREGGLGDQSDLIDQFTKDLASKTGDLLGGFDLFGPVKRKFLQLKDWFKANVGPVFSAIGDGVSSVFGGIDWMAPIRNMDWGWLKSIWDTIKDIWNTGVTWIVNIVKLFADDFKEIWKTIVDAFKKVWKDIVPELAKFKELLPPIAKLFKELWTVLKPVVAIIGIVLLGAIKILSSVLANTLGPVIDTIIGILKGLIKIIRGITEFILGVFTGDWDLAWQGIKDIFTGVWDVIVSALKGVVTILWGIVSGLVEGIVDFFKWLYDVLVGHSIIPDMINAIIEWFASLPQKVWDALKSLGAKIVDVAKTAWNMFTAANAAAWAIISNWFKGRAQAVWNALVDLTTKLKQKATDSLNAFLTGAKTVWNTVTAWFGGWASAVGSKVSNIAGTLKSSATTAVNWFRDGATNAWNGVTSWFSSWYSRIKSAIGNISLANIGKSIMNSLLDGLKSAWNDTANFLSSLGNKIKSLKGPIEKDRKLLNPEGAAIMQSLAAGLKAEWPALESYVRTIAPGIQDAIVRGITNVAPTALKSAASANATSLLGTPEARLATATGGGSAGTTTEYGTRNEMNFYGDLSFPNITDGGDAEEFLRNLEALIG